MGGMAQKVSAGQAEQYYYGKDAIYTQDGPGSNMQWIGAGAKELGLEGKFQEGDLQKFTNLLYGKDPEGTEQLVGIGKEGTLQSHDKNAATDIALTLPKSFGIIAMEDPAAREAISRAFKTVAEHAGENYIYGREQVDGKTERVQAGLIGVLVEHGTSRANDTHPHAHFLALNNVIRPDGTHGTLENKETMMAQKAMQQDLYNEAAKEMKAIGYAMDYEKKGSHIVPEVSGIDKETRDLFSKRNQEIKNSPEMRAELKLKMPNATENTIDNMMQRLTKESKDPDMTEAKLVDSHRAQAEAIGKNLPAMVANAKSLGREHDQAHTPADYVKFALQDNIEKESVLKRETVINDAIKLGCGDVVRADIEKAFGEAQKSGQIVQLDKNAYSTPEVIKNEKQIAITAVTQATKFEPLMSKEASQNAIQAFETKKGWDSVSQGQREAITLVLSENTGRLAIIQGDSGAGKSAAFEAIQDSLKNMPNIEVTGLGFQGKAAAELERSSGIVSQTLHSFLGAKEEADNKNRKLWVVDESSMLGSEQLGKLLERAEKANAQIVMVGDDKQISSISGGDMHKKLQQYNLVKTAKMTEVKRQKYYDADGKAIKPGGDISKATNAYAVKIAQDLKQGNFEAAFAKLDGAGQIKEISDKKERITYAAERLVASHKDTVLLTMTNADRKSAIEQIRPMQKSLSQIGQEDHTFKTNDPVSVSGVYRRLATSYSEGNYVTLGKDLGDLKAGSILKIAEVDKSSNKITFDFNDPDNQLKVDKSKLDIIETMKADGAKGEISLKDNGASLSQFKKVDTSFSIDEKVMFLKNDNTHYGKAAGIKNGVTGYIRSIDEATGMAKIELDSGKFVDQQMEGAYLALGTVMTTNKAQGISERHTLVLATAEEAGQLANTKTGYTALTRHEQSVEVITDNKEELLEAISRESNKTSTLDYMDKTEMQELQARAAESREATQPPTEIEKIEERIMQSEAKEVEQIKEISTDQVKETSIEQVQETGKGLSTEEKQTEATSENTSTENTEMDNSKDEHSEHKAEDTKHDKEENNERDDELERDEDEPEKEHEMSYSR